MNDHILKVGTCLHCLLGLKLTADHKLNTYIRAITKRKIGKNPRNASLQKLSNSAAMLHLYNSQIRPRMGCP